jgi:tetratricopeptide (TPR) repeat protein
MVLPIQLSTFQQFSSLSVIIGMLAIALIIIRIITKKNKQWNRIIFSFCFFAVSAFTYLDSGNGFAGMGYDIITSHAYFCAIGFILLAVELFPSKLKESGKLIPIVTVFATTIYLSAFSVIKANDYRNADTFFTNAIESNPNCAYAHFCYGKYLHLISANESAMACFQKAIDIKSDYAQAYLSLGDILEDEMNNEQALDNYSKAYQINRSNTEALYQMAEIKEKLKMYQPALNDLNTLIEMDPHSANALNERGLIYTKLNNYNNALLDFTQSIKFHPENKDVYYNRSLVYIEVKDFVSACNDLQKASAMGKDEANLLLQLYCYDLIRK